MSGVTRSIRDLVEHLLSGVENPKIYVGKIEKFLIDNSVIYRDLTGRRAREISVPQINGWTEIQQAERFYVHAVNNIVKNFKDSAIILGLQPVRKIRKDLFDLSEEEISSISKRNFKKKCSDVPFEDQVAYFHWTIDQQLENLAASFPESRQVDYINFQKFIESTGADWDKLFYDYVHLNKEGQVILAHFLAEKILFGPVAPR